MKFYEMTNINDIYKDSKIGIEVQENDDYDHIFQENDISNVQEFLYEDETINLNEEYLKIYKYYYPLKKEKLILISKIKKISIFKLTRLSGKYKFFGLNWDLSWFHLDKKRPQKEFGIKIDDGSLISVVITPNNPEFVYDLIKSIIKKII